MRFALSLSAVTSSVATAFFCIINIIVSTHYLNLYLFQHLSQHLSSSIGVHQSLYPNIGPTLLAFITISIHSSIYFNTCPNIYPILSAFIAGSIYSSIYSDICPVLSAFIAISISKYFSKCLSCSTFAFKSATKHHCTGICAFAFYNISQTYATQKASSRKPSKIPSSLFQYFTTILYMYQPKAIENTQNIGSSHKLKPIRSSCP